MYVYDIAKAGTDKAQAKIILFRAQLVNSVPNTVWLQIFVV